MPRVIVVFFGAESPAATLAEAARDGAMSVRFSEVDLREGALHQATTTHRHKRLESPNHLLETDGIVICCPAAGDVPTGVSSLLDALERTPPETFANRVFGVVGGENTVLLGRVARLGGIIVAEPRGFTDPEERAKALGARVATVVGWIRHVTSHHH